MSLLLIARTSGAQPIRSRRDGLARSGAIGSAAVDHPPVSLRRRHLIDAFPAALIGFTLNVGAYSSEVIRAALTSISKGQWEAAYSIGMTTRQAMARTILPQATRVALPPLGNTFISLVKDTSLAAAITVPELFQQAQRIVAVTYEPLILYIEAALIYLVFSSVLTTLQTRLETRFGRYGGFMDRAR